MKIKSNFECITRQVLINLLINKIYLLKNLLESFESVRYTLLSLNNIELIKITNISCFFFV